MTTFYGFVDTRPPGFFIKLQKTAKNGRISGFAVFIFPENLPYGFINRKKNPKADGRDRFRRTDS